MPRNTASYSPSRQSNATSAPISQPRRNSTPMSRMISWRFSITSFSSLKGGMPKVRSPPMRAWRSNTTGCTPPRTRMSAHPSPAGPAPTIATRLPVGCTFDMSGFQPALSASSVMYFSIAPMLTPPSPYLACRRPRTGDPAGRCGRTPRGASWSCETAPPPRTDSPPRSASASWGCSCEPGISTRRRDSRRRYSAPPAAPRRPHRRARRSRGNCPPAPPPPSWGGLSAGCRGIAGSCRPCVAQPSGRAPQAVDQRVDGGRFGLHHPELGQKRAQVVQDLLGPGAGGLGDVPREQSLEVLHVRLHGLGVNAADVDELVVVAIDEVALQVQHVGKATGEPGAEVDPGAPQHAHRAPGHVLAAVIPRTLDHRDRARIAHREALTGKSCGVQLPAGSAIQAGVAHDDRVLRQEARAARVAQHDPAGRHALADVVVGIAFQVQVEAAGIPYAEALPGVAAAAHGERRILHAVVAPAPRNLARQARADGAVEVAEVIRPFAPALVLDGAQHVAHHALGELAPIEGRVGRRDAELRRILGQAAGGQDGGEVELALPRRTSAL